MEKRVEEKVWLQRNGESLDKGIQRIEGGKIAEQKLKKKPVWSKIRGWR